MAEFALAAFSALSGSAAAGGAAAGAAAGGAAAATAATSVLSGSFLWSALQGGAGLLSAMGAVREGQQRATAMRAEAGDALSDARSEQINAMTRQDALRRDLLKTTGDQDTAAAASGVDLSFGTPALARREAVTATDRALSIDQSASDMRTARLKEKAAMLDASANDAAGAGWIKGIGSGLLTGASLFSRG